jgi:hypothetical protein
MYRYFCVPIPGNRTDFLVRSTPNLRITLHRIEGNGGWDGLPGNVTFAST